MLDFFRVSTRCPKRGIMEIYPKFIVRKSQDLMIRGRDFYAVWNEDEQLWSTDEDVALQLIDRELDRYYQEVKDKIDDKIRVMHMWDAETGMVDRWHKYIQKQMRDDFHPLDANLTFANTVTKKDDYVSRKLPYSLKEGSIDAWNEIVGTLYSKDERRKIEWAIGAIVSGDSKHIQKFIVMYGSAGTGKSTIINIIEKLFEGYYAVFDAKALGSSTNAFALEAFKSNPLVGIQHDGDLSRIEDNTRLNSVVSHELMTVNEKFKPTYPGKFNCFLFMATNKPVKITDAKSGIIRRLIDVSPTGNLIPEDRYNVLVEQVKFELGAIAHHCLKVYKKCKHIYDKYVPFVMMDASNDFYNFITYEYDFFRNSPGVTLDEAWEKYDKYCNYANAIKYSQRYFKQELKNYFREFKIRTTLADGTRVRSYYSGFKYEKFESVDEPAKEETTESDSKFIFKEQPSIFDETYKDCLAQYAKDDGTPMKPWSKVTTTLSDIDTSKLHYVLIPENLNHLTVDFDLRDDTGNKSLEKNLEAISTWPQTYAELSKSGQGIHLEYIYDGDISKVSRVFGDNIELKTYKGNSALRRQLTKCTNSPIAVINSGVPLKEEKKKVAVGEKVIKTERNLRHIILNNLHKKYLPSTKSSIDFIYKILEDAYNSDLIYDVYDMKPRIMDFALNSTNQSVYCRKLVQQMKFRSKNLPDVVKNKVKSNDIIFFDCEVFPNLFIICWKVRGSDRKVHRMINPSPDEVKWLFENHRCVGFNNRRYDNHVCWARAQGCSLKGVYKASKAIIDKEPGCFYGIAWNWSYTDIYDFSSKKQSLKKFEIELGIHHQELGYDWNSEIPEDKWSLVADYCVNDVVATEAVFEARYSDFVAREILADISGGIVNDTTNSLTTKLIFGDNKEPQSEFNYIDLSTDPRFKQYKFFYDPDKKKFQSVYRGEEIGEGGYVFAKQGKYNNVYTFDVSSMHPHTIIALNLFGDRYTKIFEELVNARVAIKHGDFELAGTYFDGKLKKYLTDKDSADALAGALKIAINSVYGLTAAKFPNAFRDQRNKDNIVAKRGELFMINLRDDLISMGANVIHIKTDSIKVENPSKEVQDYILNYGKDYGYDFEIESIYEKMCLVNDAVYIAKCAENDPGWIKACKKAKAKGKPEPTRWTATGAQFAVPYVFKTLFSKEAIEFKDLCETKTVTSALYLDMNENLPDVSIFEKVKALRESDAKKTKKDTALLESYSWMSEEELDVEIAKGHDYVFVGRAGLFCPMKTGSGGGLLMREQNGKYYSATGAKGYRWMEAEVVEKSGAMKDIDRSYYRALVDDAVEAISEFCDFDEFADEDMNFAKVA